MYKADSKFIEFLKSKDIKEIKKGSKIFKHEHLIITVNKMIDVSYQGIQILSVVEFDEDKMNDIIDCIINHDSTGVNEALSIIRDYNISLAEKISADKIAAQDKRNEEINKKIQENLAKAPNSETPAS